MNIIRSTILMPLESCLNGERTDGYVNWNAVWDVARSLKMMPGDLYNQMHEELRPYYWQYLCATLPSDKGRLEAYRFVSSNIFCYDGLGDWIGGMDFMDLVEILVNSRKDSGHFFHILMLLLSKGYRHYIANWPREEIEEEIELLEVTDNRYKGEYFCIMLAMQMIERADVPDDHKEELEKLLYKNWRFLLNVYSVMVKRIVGSGFKVFAQLANNVNLMTEYYPYIHLFYDAILLRQEELFPTDKEKDKMVKHMTRMEDIMKDTQQEPDLDELCNIIFSGVFEALLQKKRFKTYDELNEQVKQLEGTVGSLTKMIEITVRQLKEAVESRVPISVIENQLLRLDGTTAWAIYAQLNALLQSENSWKLHSAEISEKILAKRDKEAVIVNGPYYGSGSTHDDHSKQIKIEGNSANTPLLAKN